MALVASALILSLLVIQIAQVWASPAVNTVIPNTYGTLLGPEQTSAPAATSPIGRSRVSTNHLTVQLTFPKSVYPGQSVNILATTTARSNGRIIRFTIDIFSLFDKQLVRLTSQAIATDMTVTSGDSWKTSLVVFIPPNAQAGPLIGTVTEVWQVWQEARQEPSNYYSNYYSSYYGTPNYAPYCSHYQDQRYYAQNYPYYDNQVYGTQEYIRYPSGFIALRTSPPTLRYTYVPSYQCGPAPYYGSNYAPNYPNYAVNYAPQASSKQTFFLTYVLGYYP
jgi:hypothetical protein